MNYLDRAPRQPVSPTFAGGVAGLGEIVSAAFDAISYGDNSNSAYVALERAYADRIKAIREATGVTLDHPLVAADAERRRLATERPQSPFRAPDERRDPAELYRAQEAEFAERLTALAGQFPGEVKAIRPAVPVIEDARKIAREADARLGRLAGSRDGFGKWGAIFLGGGAAMFRDPIQIGALALGGGPGAARTVAGRLLTVAAKEALISGATEAAIQPAVQSWRREAGLSSGFDDALRSVLFAAGVGGVAGAGLSAVAETAGRLARRAPADEAADLALARLDVPESARAIFEGNADAAAERLPAIREQLTPEARGALDARETLQIAERQRPAAATPARHDAVLAAADAAVTRGDYDLRVEPDPAQVERVVASLIGPAAARPAKVDDAGETIIDFLIARGGIRDYRGELAAIGGDRIAQRFRGRLAREDGMPLDRAREAAAEAGFLDGRFGTAERAGEQSTIADLLDAIDEAARAGDRPGAEGGERAYVEGLVSDIASYAGPAVSDDIIERAARLANERGVDPFDALESVFVAVDDEGVAVNAGERSGEVLPGWSDEELDAAAANRPAGMPEPTGPEDPAQLLDDDLASDEELAALGDDFLLPDEGELITAGMKREQLARADNMRMVLEACRI